MSNNQETAGPGLHIVPPEQLPELAKLELAKELGHIAANPEVLTPGLQERIDSLKKYANNK